jgi:hypothetical protein
VPARTVFLWGTRQLRDIQEALAIAEHTGDPEQLSWAHVAIGSLAIDAGRLGEARRQRELALDAAQRSGDLDLEAVAHQALGWVTWAGTNPAADINRILEENLAFAREHDSWRMEGSVLSAQAVEAARHGRIPEARRLLAEGEAISEDPRFVLLRGRYLIESRPR